MGIEDRNEVKNYQNIKAKNSEILWMHGALARIGADETAWRKTNEQVGKAVLLATGEAESGRISIFRTNRGLLLTGTKKTALNNFRTNISPSLTA